MKTIKIISFGLILIMTIGLNYIIVEAATDTIKTYRDYEKVKLAIAPSDIKFKDKSIVYIVVSDGASEGGKATITATVDDYTVRIVVHDNGRDEAGSIDYQADDGLYTGQFRIDRSIAAYTDNPLAGSVLPVGNMEWVTIEADIDGTQAGTTRILGEYEPPIFITPPVISKEVFSPYITPGTVTISFEARDKGTWSYEISINNTLLSGNSTGTCTGTQSVVFDWDGKDKDNNVFPSGGYYIDVVITDEAGNMDTATVYVYIDTIPPNISEFIAVPDPYFAPGTGEDTIIIKFTGYDATGDWEYILSYAGEVLCGEGATGTVTGTQTIEFVWDGKYGTKTEPVGTGTYDIWLTVKDTVGNIATFTITTPVIVEHTPPAVLDLIVTNRICSPESPLKIKFTGEDNAGQWRYEIFIGDRLAVGTQNTTSTGECYTRSEIEFIWSVTSDGINLMGDGMYPVEIILTDLAGHKTYATFTTIVDKTAPMLEDLSVSPEYFSPIASPSTVTISFKGRDILGTWMYKITIDDMLLIGTPTAAQGTITEPATITFVWDGKAEGISGYLPSGKYVIEVLLEDIVGNQRVGTVDIEIDAIPPLIILSEVSDEYFSPLGDQPTTTVSFTASDNSGKWSYVLSVDGKTPTGIGDVRGTLTGTKEVSFIWDGGYEGGKFDDGTYAFTITVYDVVNNKVTSTHYITIDNTPPEIISITEDTDGITQYLGEEIRFRVRTTEEMTGNIILTSSKIESAEEIITGGEFKLNDRYWDQYEIGACQVGGSVCIYVIDVANNNITKSEFSISDYTTPQELFNAINTQAFNNQTYGSISYSTATDKVIIHAASGYEIGLSEYCDKPGYIPLFTQLKLPVTYIELTRYTSFEYRCIYTVPQTADIGTWTVWSIVTDNAGNTGSLKGPIIRMDGSQHIPVAKCKIISLRIDPAPSKHIFNTLLKKMHIQMVVAKIDKELSADKDEFKIDSEDTHFVLYSPEIKQGDRVIIWNDYIRDEYGKVIHEYASVWTKIADNSGTITFSDADLYFGSPTGIYSTEVFKLSNFHVAIGTFTYEGEATVDIGIIQQGIQLYDDGKQDNSWDVVRGDGIFSGTYIVHEKIDVMNVPIYARFTDATGQCVQNDGYPYDDEISSNDIMINIDTIRPNIRLLGADAVFNPLEGEKCEIKYALSQDTVADVHVVIKTKDNRLIKDLGTYKATIGDNVCYWEGNDEEDKIVRDGKYYYHIIATDNAGNISEDVYGVIVVSYVKVNIEELTVVVPKATPGKGIDYISIKVIATMDGTPSQLENLGFRVDHTSDVWLRPHALFELGIYDKYGEPVHKLLGPDLTDGCDTDPFPNGKPNYLTPPDMVENWLIYHGAPEPLRDVGDGNKDNDWNILVPFHKEDKTNKQERHYRSEINILYYFDPPLAKGTFYVRGVVKLVSAKWIFVDYDRDVAGNYIGEKWHCKPEYAHYGLHSKPIEQRFEVLEIKLPHPDNIPPVVYESYPADGVVISPFKAKNVWVKVLDEGIGVDFHPEASYITLLGPDGMEVPGKPISNGKDKLYWIIDEAVYPDGLYIPGVYTINIVVRDKGKNLTTMIRKFTVRDDIPPEILDVIPEDGAVKYTTEDEMVLSAILSEYNTGKSGVDLATSKITLRKGDVEIDIQRYKKEGKIDKDYGTLTYYVPFSKLTPGTYTMTVHAYDIPGNYATIQRTFYVLPGVEILFDHPELGKVPCLIFDPDTEIGFEGTTTVVSTQTFTIKEADIDEDDFLAGYTLFGVPINIFIGTKSVYGATCSITASLRLYFTDKELAKLPSVIFKNYAEEIKLFGYDEKDRKWVEISDITVREAERMVVYDIESHKDIIMGTYTLAYKTPPTWVVKSEEPTTENTKQEWEEYGLYDKVWMELAGTVTTYTGVPIPKGSITIGIVREYHEPPEGYKILEPVVAFYLGDKRIIKFNQEVTIRMHYSKKPLEIEKEDDLDVFRWIGTKWEKITDVVRDINENWISFKVKETHEMYAIMYPIRELPPEEEEVTEIFEESVYCYPNPVKGGIVKFRYYLAKDNVKMTVKIYTLLGDLVWEGSKIETLAGMHGSPNDADALQWNCCNSAGEPVAAGVYIYKLIMEPQDGSAATTVTKKLIVIQ